MSRLSLRVLGTAVRTGLLFSILFCAEGLTSFTFGQMDYERMDAEKRSGMMNPSDPNQQKNVSLTNYGSGIKHTENALSRLRALLYSDTVSVVRFNMTKVDYEGLASFADVFIDEAGGAVQSTDSYQVELREYQKAQAKQSIKRLLSTLQNSVVQLAFNKKFDDLFKITYANGSDPGCSIFAIPCDGLTEAEQNTAMNALVERVSPITAFKRYGFIVAVVEHDSAVKPNLDPIHAKYEKLIRDDQRESNSYGSYTSNGNNSNNSYSANGSSYGSETGAETNSFGVSSDLLVAYNEEIQKATKDAIADSRKTVLPYVRKRFSKPASEEDSKQFVEPLVLADGATIFAVITGTSGISELTNANLFGATKEDVAQPFSSMGQISGGDEDAEETDSLSATLTDSLLSSKTFDKVKTSVLALSLVGSPKLVVIANFDSSEDANDFSEAFSGGLTTIRLLLESNLEKSLPTSVSDEEKDNFKSFLSTAFDSIKPKVQDARAVIVVDLDVVKQNAVVFRPLLGGKEAKSQQEIEAEGIAWDSVNDAQDTEEKSEADDDDPFSSSDSSGSDADEEQTDSQDNDEDDPFGADDEDDPFA